MEIMGERTKTSALVKTGGGPPFVVQVAEGDGEPAEIICDGQGNNDCVFMKDGRFGTKICKLDIGTGLLNICKSTYNKDNIK